jgi:hypothetical protein
LTPPSRSHATDAHRARRTALIDLRLQDATVHIEAEEQNVKVSGLPDDWEVVTPGG